MAHSTYDTNETILQFLKANPGSSSKQIHEGLGITTGYATVKDCCKNSLPTTWY